MQREAPEEDPRHGPVQIQSQIIAKVHSHIIEDLGTTPRTCKLEIGSRSPRKIEGNGERCFKQMCALQVREKWKERDKREREKEIDTSIVFLRKKIYTVAEVLYSLEDS